MFVFFFEIGVRKTTHYHLPASHTPVCDNTIKGSKEKFQRRAEAITWRCSVKNVFLKALKNTKQKTCAGIFSLQLYKKETPAQIFFCEEYKIYKSELFIEYLRITASGR